MSQRELFDFNPSDADGWDLIEKGGAALVPGPDGPQWPQRLLDLFEIERVYSVRRGMDADAAARDAAERVTLLATYLGGRPWYVPNGETLRLALRDAQIFDAFHRVGAGVLATRYSMTTKQVYEIVARQRALLQGRVQGRLFDDDGSRKLS